MCTQRQYLHATFKWVNTFKSPNTCNNLHEITCTCGLDFVPLYWHLHFTCFFKNLGKFHVNYNDLHVTIYMQSVVIFHVNCNNMNVTVNVTLQYISWSWIYTFTCNKVFHVNSCYVHLLAELSRLFTCNL